VETLLKAAQDDVYNDVGVSAKHKCWLLFSWIERLVRGYKGRVEEETRAKEQSGREQSSHYGVEGVFSSMPKRRDFTRSFPCEVLQLG